MPLSSRSSGPSERAGPQSSPLRTRHRRASGKPELRLLPFSVPDLDDDELAELTETLRCTTLIAGEKVRQFEQEFAKFIGVKHAVAVNNGTTAFRLTIQSLGLTPGDEVILSPCAPAVAAELVRAAGGTLRFVDITDRSSHLSPELLQNAITDRTRAVLVSHVAGLPAEMDELLAIARRHRLIVIEDAGQALPATYRHDRVGGLGDISCFTFFAQKALSLGEGGMICTNDADVANRCRLRALNPWSLASPDNCQTEETERAEGTDRTDLALIRTLDMDTSVRRRGARAAATMASYAAQLRVQADDGYQVSMNELSAALGVAQLRRATGMWQRRLEIAVTYNAAFSRFVELQCPADRRDSQHAWHSYLLRLNLQRLKLTRDQFITELQARHIGATTMPPPLHLHPAFAHRDADQPEICPVATQEHSRKISLPIYSRMSDADVQRVIDAVEAIVIRVRVGVKPR